MRLLLRDHVQAAIHSLRINCGRSILTALGIAIGIASVTAILALAEGATRSVASQVEAIGGNVAVIRPGGEATATTPLNPLTPQGFATSTLTTDDVTHVQAIDRNLAVAPIMTLTGTLHTDDERVHGASIVATTPDLDETAQLPLEDGQFIDEQTNKQTATLGQQLAIDLFGEESPLGETFTLHGQSFTVIGVLKRQPSPINYSGIEVNRAAIIHLDTGISLNDGRSQIQQINIKAPSAEALDTLLPRIDTALMKDRDDERDFSIYAGEAIAQPTNQLFTLLARVMTAIAAISLLVGGIGIMNIMLVSVAERTREIGIRKSVGASHTTILMQFLIESLAMSVLGGIVGVILGAVVALIIGSFLFFVPAPSWTIAGIAFGLSIIVGVAFGMYPAVRAARKDPIESLRQYR